MKQIALEAYVREKKGKEYCKKVRRRGFIPAVLYGKQVPSVMIEVPEREFRKAISTHAGHNVIIELQMQGNGKNSQLAMIAEIQKDPLRIRILHIDFRSISLDIKVTVEVPVHIQGEPKGVKRGGILDHIIWMLEMEALPLNIPEEIVVNVSSLDIGESITIKDLKPPESAIFLGDPDAIIAIVHPPRTAEAIKEEAPGEAVVAQQQPAQPELIKKGKEEEEK